MYIYFFKHYIHPVVANENVSALFVKRNGKAINSSTAHDFTQIVKKVTKAFLGKTLHSRYVRYMGNAHFKANLQLSDAENAILDKATNHCSQTAKKYYMFTGAEYSHVPTGSPIISKFFQNNASSTEAIVLAKQEIEQLSSEEQAHFAILLQKLPLVSKLIAAYDATMTAKKETVIALMISNDKESNKTNKFVMFLYNYLCKKVGRPFQGLKFV